MVYFNPQVVAHKGLEELKLEAVKKAFGSEEIEVYDDNSKLLSSLKSKIDGNSIALIMSSGSFDGINWKEELNPDS